MDIGPTELPVQPILPAERVRRVEESPDPQQNPQHRQSDGETRDEDSHDAPQDSVDVSETYLAAHPEHIDTEQQTDTPSAEDDERGRHIDIEA